MKLIFEIVIVFFYFSLAEYLVHRFAMHRPLLGRRWWWREHAVEHHGKGRNDINIDLGPGTVATVASPLFVLGLWFGWSFALTVLACCIGYSAAWTALHRAHHDLGCGWLHGWGWYQKRRREHIAHHENPQRNFGLIFPFTDDWFGTRIQLRPSIDAQHSAETRHIP